MNLLNETHDPALTSWVPSAQRRDGDFPIQNLPHGVFRRRRGLEGFRGGIAIGDQILDMAVASHMPAFSDEAAGLAALAGRSELNALMAASAAERSALRRQLSRVLREGAPEAAQLRHCLVPQSEVEYAVPAHIGDYTDFFTSLDHCLTLGRQFRPDAPLMPNFKWMPIGYHGRASSIVIDGTPVTRPNGQRPPATPGAAPGFGPTDMLDYELELGAFVGPGNYAGEPIDLADAEAHLFGLCLLNDWSARDLQGWESVPLGPFLSKNFATTVSPWIVTLEALAPYRVAPPRAPDDPAPLPYLAPPAGSAPGGFDIRIEAWIAAAHTPDRLERLSQSSFRHAWWSFAQMLAHHASGGCNLRPGDLLGSGTQSGPGRGEQGCLMELGIHAGQPALLADGTRRAFLENGDRVLLRAHCEADGRPRIGFGECSGVVRAAVPHTIRSQP